MQSSVSKILKTFTQPILALTVYDMVQSSPDFEDVRTAMKNQLDWSIELFRSCFAIHLTNGSHFFMLSTLFFLAMAEGIHMHYSRLSSMELKERAELIGYAAFVIPLIVLDIGFVIVRIAGLVALSGSPILATSLVFITMSPSAIFPMLPYLAKHLRWRKPDYNGEEKIEPGVGVDESGV